MSLAGAEDSCSGRLPRTSRVIYGSNALGYNALEWRRILGTPSEVQARQCPSPSPLTTRVLGNLPPQGWIYLLKRRNLNRMDCSPARAKLSPLRCWGRGSRREEQYQRKGLAERSRCLERVDLTQAEKIGQALTARWVSPPTIQIGRAHV